MLWGVGGGPAGTGCPGHPTAREGCSAAPGGSCCAGGLEFPGSLARAAPSSPAPALSPGPRVHVALHLFPVLLGHGSPVHSDGGH